jgi:hypothetical protein
MSKTKKKSEQLNTQALVDQTKQQHNIIRLPTYIFRFSTEAPLPNGIHCAMPLKVMPRLVRAI